MGSELIRDKTGNETEVMSLLHLNVPKKISLLTRGEVAIRRSAAYGRAIGADLNVSSTSPAAISSLYAALGSVSQ
jgi:hypothetical protein